MWLKMGSLCLDMALYFLINSMAVGDSELKYTVANVTSPCEKNGIPVIIICLKAFPSEYMYDCTLSHTLYSSSTVIPH